MEIVWEAHSDLLRAFYKQPLQAPERPSGSSHWKTALEFTETQEKIHALRIYFFGDSFLRFLKSIRKLEITSPKHNKANSSTVELRYYAN